MRSWQLHYYQRRGRRGFTLIELLTVVAIIIIFASIILASNQNATTQAYIATYKQQEKELQNCIDEWVNSQPTVSSAITSFNSSSSSPASVLALAQQMMEFNSRESFTVENGYIVSDASKRQGIGWIITWPNASPSDQYLNGPQVTETTIPTS